MVAVFFINYWLLFLYGLQSIYGVVALGQLFFYGASFLGWQLEKKQMKIKIFFIPYYFCLMNYAVIAGLYRYFFGTQTVLWEKAKRK